MPKTSFERFRRTVLSRSVSPDLSERLSEIGIYQRVTRGKSVKLEGRSDQLVFLAEGATKLVASEGEEKEQILAFHFPGDMIYVPRRNRGGFQLLALADCRAISFSANSFLDAAEDDPAILRTILTRTFQALHRSRTKAIRLGRKSAQKRIADFLLAMADRIGTPEGHCTRLTLPMSRRDIGNSLGLTIETVSRQLTELREQRLIETCGRSIVQLRDLDRLAQTAGHLAGPPDEPEICAGSKNDLTSLAIAAVQRGV